MTSVSVIPLTQHLSGIIVRGLYQNALSYVLPAYVAVLPEAWISGLMASTVVLW